MILTEKGVLTTSSTFCPLLDNHFYIINIHICMNIDSKPGTLIKHNALVAPPCWIHAH